MAFFIEPAALWYFAGCASSIGALIAAVFIGGWLNKRGKQRRASVETSEAVETFAHRLGDSGR